MYNITKTDSDITLQEANTTMKVNYVCNIMRFTCMCTFHSTHKQQWERYTARAAKRIGGTQGKYKKWDPFIDCVRGVWGTCPQEILRFYLLGSVFWGLLRLLFAHAYSPYSAYIHASYSLHFRFQIEKYDVRGLAAAAQRSHKIKVHYLKFASAA